MSRNLTIKKTENKTRPRPLSMTPLGLQCTEEI